MSDDSNEVGRCVKCWLDECACLPYAIRPVEPKRWRVRATLFGATPPMTREEAEAEQQRVRDKVTIEEVTE